jgi:histidinol-phosphate aminotransferase
MSALELARAEIRALVPYSSARMEAAGGDVLLNANESPWAPFGDEGLDCHRYPDPQPAALVTRLASLFGVHAGQLLVGRGSDEAIDLLVRAFCRAGQDAILVQPPTFGMYGVCARIQQAAVVEVPLTAGFALDVDAVLAALAPAVKLVFVCAPNNPSGAGVPLDELERLAGKLAGRALLVVDEAYAEFADGASAATLLDRHEHLVVLRTLSKAWALAGARIGCLLAHPDVVSLLRRILPPYPVPRPCIAAAMNALSAAGQAAARARIEIVRAERTRMADVLVGLPGVRAVLPSQANFLAVRFDDAEAAFRRLLGAGIVVRDVRHYTGLSDALRITIGAPAQNDRVLAALGEAVNSEEAPT